MKINLPHISLEVTTACNLNCSYCYNHWKANNESCPDYSYKQNLKTLKKLLKVANLKHINFTGGEPLMAERFQELVLFARLKGLSTTIISNGNYGNKQDYEQLVKLGVSMFELPIHSYKSSIHDNLTNITGSWEKSVEMTKYLIEQKTGIVSVVVLTKENCANIDKTLEFIHSLGINRIMVNRFNIGGQGINDLNKLMMTRQELNDAFAKISIKAKELKVFVSSNVCTPICILDPHNFKDVYFTSCSPDILKRPVTIDALGNIRFCNHSPTVLGNIFKQPIERIFKNPVVDQWNTTPDFCTGCKAFDRCRSGCRAASEQVGLSLTHPDPILQYMKPEKIF